MKDDQAHEMAEVIRKKYRYRQLIFSGKLVLPHKRAAQLLGPDCMYQLYALQGSKKPGKKVGRKKVADPGT
jgi:hypothetical protein